MAYIPILTYHRLLPGEPTGAADPKRISVSAAQFRRHLSWLRKMGYKTLRLEDYLRLLQRNSPAPARSCAITFDDGYEEVLTLGLPLLQEFGYTATVFAVPGQLGGSNKWDNGQAKLLSGEQLIRLQRAGITIGGHTCSHVHLPKVEPAVARQEILECKKRLEQLLDRPVPLFAYPYGETNDAIEIAVRNAGFEAAFATDDAPRDHAADLYRIRRVVIFPRTNIWELAWKLQRWYPAYQDFKKP